MQFINWVKKCLQSELLAQPLLATALALIFAPFSIYLGFEMNARLSRPLLSIEYVSIYSYKSFINRNKIKQELNDLTSTSLFNDFFSSNLNSNLYNPVNFSSLLADNNDIEFNNSLRKLEDFISTEIKKTKRAIDALPSKDIIEKKIIISHLPTFDESIGDSEIESNITTFYKRKIKEAKTLQNNISELKLLIKSSRVTTTKINVSLLNNGSTDGLIRNIGFITNNKIKYKIKKVPPPKDLDSKNAVPTYVVNASFSIYSENSIGKIEKNTMSEFWYIIEARKDNTFCEHDGFYILGLLDQDKNIIQKQFSCN